MDRRYCRGRWKFNRNPDEPGFMDYRTMTLYPAPGYTVDLPNRESAACLRAFGAEVGAGTGPRVDVMSTRHLFWSNIYTAVHSGANPKTGQQLERSCNAVCIIIIIINRIVVAF